jgi:TRAP-type C4-dicarboxylate transport system permease small subunit
MFGFFHVHIAHRDGTGGLKKAAAKGGKILEKQDFSGLNAQSKVSLITRVDQFCGSIDYLVKVTSMVFLTAMTLTVLIQVFGRFVLPQPFCWTEELARYLMIWGVFIGASSMIRTWENVYVDFFIEKLPSKLKKATYIGIKVILFILMVYIMIITLNVLPPVGMYQTSTALGIRMFWAHLGMIIGLGLITLQLFCSVLNALFTGGKS